MTGNCLYAVSIRTVIFTDSSTRSCSICTNRFQNRNEVSGLHFRCCLMLLKSFHLFVHFAVFKDPPYSLKECGYAGFELDIDIYFRCQRDEQKKVTFRYDLTLPSKGSTSASERRYHTIVNPSSEFRRKLLDGGGAVVYANAASNDDRSRPSDSVGDRFARGTQQNGLLETVLPRSPSKTVSDGLQLSKPKLGSSSSSVGGGGGGDTKKHKSKSSQDDNVMKPSSTFANLFGTPITKVSNSKQSPEQKISNNSGSTSSNNTKLLSSSNAGGGSTSAAISASSGNSNKQISQKTSASSSSKDKSDKSSKSKKEKNKVGSSPMKDGKELTSSKKGSATSSAVDDKHQRREDIRKEKSHNKDRERSKDKPSKRPVSPKALAASRSPKRSASPSSRNNSSNRHLTDVPSSATQSILSARHIDEKASSSSSTNKKSKKDKRDKSFEKERDRGVDAKKDGKSMPTSSKLPKDEKPLSKSLEKINGTSKKDRDGGGGSGNSTPKDSIRDKSSSSNNAKYRQVFDGKIDSPAEILQKNSAASCGLERENKKVDKHDGSDRKHKHKKKDKKEKGRSGSKDRKKDKEKVSKAGVKEMIDDNPTSLSTNHKRSYGQTPPLQSTHSASSVKAATSSASLMSTATMHSKLSDDSSSDFDMDDDYPTTTRPSSPPPVKHEKPDVVDSITSEHSSMIGLPDVVTKVSPSHRATLGESPTKQTKKSGKESKSKSLIAAAAAASKEEFQVSKENTLRFC